MTDWFTNSEVRTARKGEPIRARQWNRLRDFMERAYAQPEIVLDRSRSWAESMVHEITAVHGDYLECVRVWRGTDRGTEVVRVARPELLRRSVTSRDGVTYVYLTDQRRTASKSGETDEDQWITPEYLVGDLIEVMIVRGLTGVTEVDQQRGRPVDRNADGRAWATLPP